MALGLALFSFLFFFFHYFPFNGPDGLCGGWTGHIFFGMSLGVAGLVYITAAGNCASYFGGVKLKRDGMNAAGHRP